jgi:cob(I)alamin adenosyltransferase
MNDEDKKKLTNRHNAMLSEAMDRVYQGKTNLLVLDEFFAAYNCNLFDRELANRLVFGIQNRTELILTGRDPEQKFLDTADYVSEIKSIKHPYEHGISARAGIEY